MPRRPSRHPSESADSEIAEAIRQALAPVKSVEVRKGFSGRPTFFVRGKIFAFPFAGGLVLKLPAARVNELVQRPEFGPFQMRGKPAMKEWIVLYRAFPKAYRADLDLLREAMAFAGGAQAKLSSKRKAR